MQKKLRQMSLFDIHKDMSIGLENNKLKLFRLLDEYIDWDGIIPARFYTAFYQRMGHSGSIR